MGKVNVGSGKTYNTIKFDSFKGVDFSKDPSLVSANRSPDALNMISDEGSNPIKRRGWEYWKDTGSNAKIDNLWSYETSNGQQMFVANSAGSIYNWTDGTPALMSSNLTTGYHPSCMVDKGLLVFTGTTLMLLDSTATPLGDNFKPYVPKIIIGKSAGNTNSGGTSYEGVNLLTREVRETFFPNGGSTFTVSLDINTSKSITVKNIVTDTTLTVSSTSGKTITLSSSVETNNDIASIEISYFSAGTDNSSKITKAKYVKVFAEGSGQRWFIVEENSNIIRYSGLNDYSYWSDLNYMVVGQSDNKIQGFLPLSNYLGVIKENPERESTLYFISPTEITDSIQSVDSSNNIVSTSMTRYEYKIEPGVSGIGAVSSKTFDVLSDEPLFLSKQGVFGIVSNTTTSEKAIRRRSLFVDSKLCAEPNLKDTVSCIYKGFYVLSVNSHAYVFDSRQKTNDYSGNTSYSYECYYWENVPATALLSYDDILYFGTSDGKICKFKYTGYPEDYSDGSFGSVLSADYIPGTAVHGVWSTNYSDDGYPQYLKTMQKKGSSITVKPYHKSTVDVYYEYDGNEKIYMGTLEVNVWDKGFEEIDFLHFTFDTRTGPRDKQMNKKIKKYRRMKLVAENNYIEPFGIFGFTKTFTNVKYTK